MKRGRTAIDHSVLEPSLDELRRTFGHVQGFETRKYDNALTERTRNQMMSKSVRIRAAMLLE